MLTITVLGTESYDEIANLYSTTKDTVLRMEHSLVALSKWESLYKKPYISSIKGVKKTPDETLAYIKFMTITQNVSDSVYASLTSENYKVINAYIDDDMTATIIKKTGGGNNRETITSEKIYYWMISFGIPFECQKWHLNRLITLIEVCSLKNKPKGKLSAKQVDQKYTDLNEQNRKKFNSKG